jgi:hypothetical protein
MNLRKHHQDDENYNPSEFSAEKESVEMLKHRRNIRKSIEDRLERKRLHDELDELDGDFDWDELDR